MKPELSKAAETEERNIISVDFGGHKPPSPAQSATAQPENVESRVSWRELLQSMERLASESGVPIGAAETQIGDCARVLADNGYDLGSRVNTEVLAVLANFVSRDNSQPIPGLVLSADPTVKDSLAALLKAAGISCSANKAKTAILQTAVGDVVPPAGLSVLIAPDVGVAAGISEAPAAINYALLLDAHAKGRPDVDKKTVQNEISVIRKFLKLLGHTLEADCGWLGGDDQLISLSANLTRQSASMTGLLVQQ